MRESHHVNAFFARVFDRFAHQDNEAGCLSKVIGKNAMAPCSFYA